jgi:methylated-DNA-protein-cysteine methyltransferase-like protein
MAVIQISEFTKKVLQNIRNIPSGKVATYKQIAILSGKPQGSRGVAWILHSCSTSYKLPWHRVLNSKGMISFEPDSRNFREQKRKLENEGIVFSDQGKLSLAKFQWKKTVRKKSPAKGKPQMFA